MYILGKIHFPANKLSMILFNGGYIKFTKPIMKPTLARTICFLRLMNEVVATFKRNLNNLFMSSLNTHTQKCINIMKLR